MVNGDKIVKLTTNILYFLIGIWGTINFSNLGLFHTRQYLYLYLFCWIWVLTILSLLKVDKEKNIKTYVFISVFAFTGLSFYTTFVLGTPYIFAVFQLLYLLCNVPGLRTYVFGATTIISEIVLIIATFLLKWFSFGEFVLFTGIFIFAQWITYIYADRSNKLVQMVREQNQSFDDLVNLMEAKFIEEKGANTAKSAFLANMSHEIRTPINAILGLNTMTIRESKNDQIVSYAKDIEKAGQTLLALVNDILDISKVEAGKMEIIPVEYDLSSVINDVVNMISFKAKSKALEVKVDADKNIPNRLYGDDVRIRQILTNLLSNAVKYTEKGTVTLSINGQRKDELMILYFSVTDTGIGIKEEDMESLFAKFERLDTEKNRNIEGTGLGMAITQKLLELMNSKLSVKSKYGEGSTFSFELVQKVIDDTPIGDINAKYVSSKQNKNDICRFIAPDAKVLVVDDNKTNRIVFKHLLKRVKIQIDEADSGQTALNIANEQEYDIIFLDHMMPGMDGIETLKKMRENTISPNINTPVIALTANAIAGSREFYLAEGFDDYLSKPIIPDKLEKLIYDLLPEAKREVFSVEE